MSTEHLASLASKTIRTFGITGVVVLLGGYALFANLPARVEALEGGQAALKAKIDTDHEILVRIEERVKQLQDRDERRNLNR